MTEGQELQGHAVQLNVLEYFIEKDIFKTAACTLKPANKINNQKAALY